MKRDGALESLWQATSPSFETSNKNNIKKVYDVVIAGGGITGLTTALLLQQQGKSCLLAEAHNIGFGTTGGSTAHLNTLLDTPYTVVEQNFSKEVAALVAKSAKEAIEIVKNLSEKYNIDCGFAYKTATLYAETEEEAETLEQIYDAALRAGAEGMWSNENPVPIPFKKAAIFPQQAQIHPTKYITGLAKAFEDAGGIILQDCAITGVEGDSELTLETTTGTINARNLVYATHIPPGINIFNFRCAPYRSYAAAFILEDNNYPDGLVYDMQDPYHYFRTQEAEGQKYLVAGGCDHKTGHNDNTDHSFIELESYINKYYKNVTMAYKWSSQYYEPVDGLPYIGLMPGKSSVYIATGYGGNGITLGTIAGRIITDLITTNYSIYKQAYDPARIKLIAGFKNFVKENADSIGEFISKRLSYEHIEQLADLEPGEAKVADFNGLKLALYKDDNGKINAFSPVCPHAGCIVTTNNAEKTWDCPCHGARFNMAGELLNGPAGKGLERIHLDDIDN